MPEMTFDVRWPDGSRSRCYSPSLVVCDHLEQGAEYELEDFVRRSTRALEIASERVREKFGFACTSAEAQREEIERRAERFASTGGTVAVESFSSEATAYAAGG